MTQIPKVSVVLPAKNAANYIAVAINSILNQTFSDLELVIVDDGSEDETLDICRSFHDKRVKCFALNGVGISRALNFGIENTQSKIICRMDADDVSMVERVHNQYIILNETKAALVASSCCSFDDNGAIAYISTTRGSTIDQLAAFTYKNYFIHPSVMFTKNAFLEAGSYNSEYDGYEDYALWLRFMELNFKIVTSDIPVLFYRKHRKQYSSSFAYNNNLGYRVIQSQYLSLLRLRLRPCLIRSGEFNASTFLKGFCSARLGIPLDICIQILNNAYFFAKIYFLCSIVQSWTINLFYKLHKYLIHLFVFPNNSDLVLLPIGGLGNQLFQYHFALVLAKQLGKTLVLDDSYYKTVNNRIKNLTPRTYEISLLLSSNKINARKHILKIIGNNYHFLLALRCCLGRNLISRADYNKKEIKALSPIIVHGYFQENVNYLDQIKPLTLSDICIKSLKLNNRHLEIIELANLSSSCCVSFRGGDFRTSAQHSLLSSEYYLKAIESIKKLSDASRFMLFIDDSESDQEFVKNLSQKNSDFVLVDPSLFGRCFNEKFYMMCHFNKHIIPNSTYSWWAAYIGSNQSEGICIGPKTGVPNFPSSYKGSYIQI